MVSDVNYIYKMVSDVNYIYKYNSDEKINNYLLNSVLQLGQLLHFI